MANRSNKERIKIEKRNACAVQNKEMSTVVISTVEAVTELECINRLL